MCYFGITDQNMKTTIKVKDSIESIWNKYTKNSKKSGIMIGHELKGV